MASVFFANKYPQAQIIAIEPEAANYELLRKNTAPYPNVTCIEAALWKTDTMLVLADPGGGNWSFQTFESSKPGKARRRQTVEGITVGTLMTRFGIDRVDFLKVDIEGAEKEVFEGTPSWVNNVGLIAVELHDWARIGCSRSVYLATKDFQWEFRRGETVYLGKGEPPLSGTPQQPGSAPVLSAPSRQVRASCRIVRAA